MAPAGALVQDFFDYPLTERFATIIGNPPYVKFQDIPPATRARLDMSRFDARTNSFLFFIEKCVKHLEPGGELIFIVPRDFVKLTAAARLNAWLVEQGTFSHWIETGDARIFDGATPNCTIFRFVRGDFSRRTLWRTLSDGSWQSRRMVEIAGQLAFTGAALTVPLSDLFEVRVGAVSGADPVFEHPDGIEMVSSKTIDTGETRRMLYNRPHPALEAHRDRLLSRRIRRFDERTWWQWGRAFADRSGPRIYVNGKTRRPRPFFLHDCPAYDGSVFALFPKNPAMDLALAVELLNDAVPWDELGFVVDGRRIYSQRSLATLRLPQIFEQLRSAETHTKRERLGGQFAQRGSNCEFALTRPARQLDQLGFAAYAGAAGGVGFRADSLRSE